MSEPAAGRRGEKSAGAILQPEQKRQTSERRLDPPEGPTLLALPVGGHAHSTHRCTIRRENGRGKEQARTLARRRQRRAQPPISQRRGQRRNMSLPPLTVSEAAARKARPPFKDQSRAVDGPEPCTANVGNQCSYAHVEYVRARPRPRHCHALLSDSLGTQRWELGSWKEGEFPHDRKGEKTYSTCTVRAEAPSRLTT